MHYQSTYAPETLERAQVDTHEGIRLLEFGANWCGYCIAAQPDIEACVERIEDGEHLKVEDGPGRPLGRSFRVRLWPTLILLENGEEIGRVVRPDRAELQALLAPLAAGRQ
ncbi:MAG: thiol reductase thioredoxin [Alcanivoracaceae bacterium]|nr:thiol reductase thioredoxin [Alcanivoracaceae bacterium]|tara:strand:+ start:2703 stop:3035 length:333 start_codon:yes stop_codon:yes gene_type:complete